MTMHANTIERDHVPTPPPCSATSFLSSTSTFLLSSCLNSGLITFSFALTGSTSPLLGRPRPSAPVALPFELLGREEDGLSVGFFRCRTGAAGKLFLLSIASTVRWKRRKRAWARRRMELRSIVFESSLTCEQLVHNDV